jgi:mono/diheme cytochrome c family protein
VAAGWVLLTGLILDEGIAAVRVFIISSLFGALSALTAVQAQHVSDIRKGRQLALEVCSSCHAVHTDQLQSPLATAPSFREIANTPGMTAAALNFWLTAHVHRTMPLLILSPQQVRDLSTYILSVRD